MTGPVEQRADGSGNIQLASIYNSTIIIGRNGGQLPLERAATPIPERVHSPALLLHARYGVVPFVGRTGLRDSLDAWLATPKPFSMRVVAGQGGLGKTRLAVDLCSSAESRQWTCGFLRPGADQDALDRLAQEAAPRLIVVDYAETRADVLTALADSAAFSATARTPVRVMLLVRRGREEVQADDRRRRWLQSLTGLSAALDAQLDQAALDVLEELDDAGRRRLSDVAAAAFAHHLGRPTPESLPMATGSPLRIVLSVLLAVQNDAPAHDADLFYTVLKHEDRYWQQRAAELELALGPRSRRLVTAVATLVAPQRREDAIDLLRLLDDFQDTPAERLADIADWAHGLYPGPAYWNPLEPDLVGESLVAEMLGKDDRATERLAAAGGARAVTVLGRITAGGGEAPAAVEALSHRLAALDHWQLFSLARTIKKQDVATSAAERLVAELRARLRLREDDSEASTSERQSLMRMGLESISEAGHLSVATRLAAIDALTSRLEEDGYPWRTQDLSSGDWRRTPLGTALLGILASAPDATLEHLTAWIGDDASAAERGGDVSRQTIAMAVLSTATGVLTEAWWRRLADDDPVAFSRLAGQAAGQRPQLLARYALRWAQEQDVALLDGALSVARKLPESEVISRVKILERLFRAEWPGRLTAAVLLSSDLPQSEEVRSHLIDAALKGRLDPLYLRCYQTETPEVVTLVLEQLWSAGRHNDVLTEIARWASPLPTIDERLLALVPPTGDEHSVAGIVEYALYALNRGESVSDDRLRLAERFLNGEYPREATLIAYGLSEPPRTEAYRSARQRLAAVTCRSAASGPRIKLLAAVFQRHDVPADWPGDEYTDSLVAGLSPVDLREVLLNVVRSTLGDEAIPFVLRTIDNVPSPDPLLGVFVDVYKETGDKYAALRAAYGSA